MMRGSGEPMSRNPLDLEHPSAGDPGERAGRVEPEVSIAACREERAGPGPHSPSGPLRASSRPAELADPEGAWDRPAQAEDQDRAGARARPVATWNGRPRPAPQPEVLPADPFGLGEA